MNTQVLSIAVLGFHGEQRTSLVQLLTRIALKHRGRVKLSTSEQANVLIVKEAFPVQERPGTKVVRCFPARAALDSSDELNGPFELAKFSALLESLQVPSNTDDQALNSVKETSQSELGKHDALRALVVDDSSTVRMQMSSALQRNGVLVKTAENAALALELLSRERFDVVILDVVMPGMNGLAACKLVRSGPGGQSVAILILTSQSAPFSRVQAALAGCDAFLTKPIGLKELFQAIDQAMAKRAAMTGNASANKTKFGSFMSMLGFWRKGA
jgi:CheY-like chemotaxis protein